MVVLTRDRAVLLYRMVDGQRRRGSGLRVGGRFVLTADHCANGTDFLIVVDGVEYPATVHVRTHTTDVDLAVLHAEDLPELDPMSVARIDRDTAAQVSDCQALGFPVWKGPTDPVLAQTHGYVPTLEGTIPLSSPNDGGFLSFKITSPAIRDYAVPAGPLDQAGSQWAGMSGAVVIAPGGLIIGVVCSHSPAEGVGSLAITPLTAITRLTADERERFTSALGMGDLTALPVLPPQGRSTSDQTGLDSPHVRLDTLPQPLLNTVVGRESEAAKLRAFISDDSVSVVSITGFGGNGKTALVDAFLRDMAPTYGGAQYIYGWHFFSQEERGAPVANTSAFWDRALRFFGFKGDLPTHEAEKAHELSHVLRQRRSLLVLDGIEPLQNPPHVNNGLLNDNAMRILLTTIARDGLPHGHLVIVTSRQRLVELGRFKFAREIQLGTLDEASGIALLETLGVRGSRNELKATALEYRGHPLSLILLSKILATDYGGDLLSRFNVKLNEAEIEANVDAVLSYYARAWTDDGPELNFMYMLSLFRRPMTEDELAVLKAHSVIGSTLRGLQDTQVNRAITHLCDYGLVIRRGTEYDTHALVRRHFAMRFQEHNSDAFLQAHAVLFKYFQELPEEQTPADLEGIDPLYRALYHGCMAGANAAALDIYWRRISRGRNFYSQKRLGAFSSDLAAVAAFFPDGWEAPVSADLTQDQRAWLLAVASFELTALGRLTEALKPRYAEIAMWKELGDFRLLCADLRNLVQILLPLGRLPEALRASEEAVQVSEEINASTGASVYSQAMSEIDLRVSALACNATVQHRIGRLDTAGNLFREAEALYGTTLDRVNGYYYGLYLMSTAHDVGDIQWIIRRGEDNLRAATAEHNLERIGNAHFTIGQALRRIGDDSAEKHLDSAVEMYQKANRVDRLPAAILERAELRRAQWLRTGSGQYLAKCRFDLAEAEQQILFSRMALHSVDLSLVKAALMVDERRFTSANQLIQSTILPAIRATRYRLRLADVDELQRRISEGGAHGTRD